MVGRLGNRWLRRLNSMNKCLNRLKVFLARLQPMQFSGAHLVELAKQGINSFSVHRDLPRVRSHHALLLGALCALVHINVYGAITYSAGDEQRDGSAQTTRNTDAFAVPSGGSIVVFAGISGSSTDVFTNVPTDGVHTFVEVCTAGTGGTRIKVWATHNATSGTRAITLVTSSAAVYINALAYSATTPASVDASLCENLATSTTPTSGTITSTVANTLLISGIVTGGNPTSVAPNNGETERFETDSGVRRMQSQDKALVASGGTTTSRTFGTTQATSVATIILKESAVAPSIASASVLSQTTDTYTLQSTITDGGAAATWYAIAQETFRAAPSCTQIKAGQNQAGAAALAAVNEGSASGVETMDLGTIANHPKTSIYQCANNSAGDSSVTNLTDEFLDVQTDWFRVTLTSVGTEAENACKQYNDDYTPDIASGDILETSKTNPDNYDTTPAVDCNIDIDGPPTPQLFNWRVYDTSVGSQHTDLTTADPGEYYINYADPTAVTSVLSRDAQVISTDPGTFDTATEFGITDPQSSTLTWTLASGSLLGRSINASTGNITGTYQAGESEAGTLAVIRATNEAGLYVEVSLYTYLFDTITAPTCVNLEVSDYSVALNSLHAGFTLGTITYAPSATVPINEIISCDPAATTEVSVNETFDIVVSTGPEVARGRYGFGFGFGF